MRLHKSKKDQTKITKGKKTASPTRSKPKRVPGKSGNQLTPAQATRLFDGQTYTCRLKVDGGSMVKGTASRSVGNDKLTETIQQNWPEGQPEYRPTEGNGRPHAEDVAIYNLLTKELDALRGDKEAARRVLSAAIQAAPCKRCAQNLRALAEGYGLKLRVKASRITKDGESGIRFLGKRRVPFRVWTEVQRQKSKSWAAGVYRTERFLERIERMKEGKTKKRALKNITKPWEDGVEDKDIERAGVLGFPDAGKGWKEQGHSRKHPVPEDEIIDGEGEDMDEDGTDEEWDEKDAALRVDPADMIVLHDTFSSRSAERRVIKGAVLEAYRQHAKDHDNDDVDWLTRVIDGLPLNKNVHDVVFTISNGPIDSQARKPVIDALWGALT